MEQEITKNKIINLEQQYCISARNRITGFTEDISGPTSKTGAEKFVPSKYDKMTHTYFRMSKYPFKRHKKR